MEVPTFRKFELDNDRFSYSPRLQLELAVRAGIGSVLCKRQWWLKWCGECHDSDDANAGDQTVRESWLDEIVTAVLQNRFDWMTRQWRVRLLRRDVLRVSASRRNHGTHRLFRSCATFRRFLQADEPTSFLCLYFSLLALMRSVDSTKELPESISLNVADAAVHQRAITLIKAAYRGDVTKDSFTALYPDADTQPRAVDFVWLHVEQATKLVGNIRTCVEVTLDDLIDRHDLMNPSSANGFISPGPVIETWMSDSIVPADVKDKFVREVAVLEDVPEHEKDWHPGSNRQVLDLVHPSLYCCVNEETKRASESPEDKDLDLKLSVTDRMYRSMFLASKAIRMSSMWTDYQWIPSDFHVDVDGRVKILSYINNLHPVRHEGMYQSIETIFSKFVLMFDRVLGWLAAPREPEPSVEERGADHRDGDYYHSAVPGLPDLPSPLPIGVEAPIENSIKAKTIQVITKIAEIHLTPENPIYPGGSWHIEGTDTENIVATGIYYFGCQNITESKLSFRVVVQPPKYSQGDDVGMASVFGLEHGRGLVQDVGAATALEDRCIVFPNTLLHKVEPFELVDRFKPGVRKILAFFLVNPSKPILSTAVIPPQQVEWINDARQAAVKHVANLPDAVVDGVLADMLPCGMSLETAREHRERLMIERGPFDVETYCGLNFNLCEH